MIDSLVTTLGVDVVIQRVTVPVFDENDVLDEDASTITEATIRAVLSNDTKGWARSVEGAVETPTFIMTVPSGTDITPYREGRPDRVIIDETPYEIGEVRLQAHPFVGTQKLTVSLLSLPGR